jgi:hypothetical protein
MTRALTTRLLFHFTLPLNRLPGRKKKKKKKKKKRRGREKCSRFLLLLA